MALPWRQEEARSHIQKQQELKESLAVLEQTFQVENRTYWTTPQDVSELPDTPVQGPAQPLHRGASSSPKEQPEVAKTGLKRKPGSA